MINLKPFLQTPGFCGPTSLKMVLDYYGVFPSEGEIAKIAYSSREKGTLAQELAKTARHFGFDVLLKKGATIKDLKYFIQKKNPIIVEWFFEDEGHYSVVVDVDKNNIVLMDPILKKTLFFVRRRKIPIKKFLRVWFAFREGVVSSKKLITRLMLVVTPRKTKK